MKLVAREKPPHTTIPTVMMIFLEYLSPR